MLQHKNKQALRVMFFFSFQEVIFNMKISSDYLKTLLLYVVMQNAGS